jgi:dTDP-4-amino-4,6-dideoxygalactose transaminase
MPNINAALASAQFEKLKNIIKLKKTIYKKYQKIFSEFKEIKLLANTRQGSSNNWLNTLVIKDRKINKNKLLSYFHKKKIYARPVWKPLHTLNHLKNFPKMNLDNTKKIYNNSISLPSGPGINK